MPSSDTAAACSPAIMLSLLSSATGTSLVRALAPAVCTAAAAGVRQHAAALTTSAPAAQQASKSKRALESDPPADEFAKKPLRARVVSEEARQVAQE